MLSVVALLAAYSGFRGRKVEHGVVGVAGEGVRAPDQGQPGRPRGARDPHARFGLVQRLVHAFVAGNKRAEQLAQNRLRPGYRPAFKAWLATDPAHNPNAPPGPSYMPQYVIPQQTQANHLDAQADEEFTAGSDAGGTADKYVRDTVFLATVLFLIGISGHVKLRQARYGLIGIGMLLLAFSVFQLAGLPAPP